jgi:hypothetical protein
VDREAFLRATLLVPAWRDAVLVMAAAGKATAAAGAEEFGTFDEEPGPETVVFLDPVVLPETDKAGAPSMPKAHPSADAPLESGEQLGRPGYGDVFMGHEPAVPNWRTMDALDLVLGQLALLDGVPAAAALTGRGWIAWCRGRGSYSAAYFEEALEIDPGYRLAELLLEMVHRGTLCGWAARKEAAWQKFGPDAA